LNARKQRRRTGMQTSPWIILGSTAILLMVVLVLAIQNTHRERRYMSELLRAKGAALIRAVEAGTRTGMMGMRWGGRQIQRLLEETARLPDVIYMAVVNPEGIIVAHSDPSQIGTQWQREHSLPSPGPDQTEHGELVTLDSQRRVFEVQRHFRPMHPGGKRAFGHMKMMMQHHGLQPESADDWFVPLNPQPLLIVAGLDITPFEDAVKSDIRTTIVLSAVMLLLGLGGFVSLFWMNSYRTARQSLQDTSAFADEVVSHLPVGLIATDRSGRISFFNDAAEKITGLRRSTVENRHPQLFLPKKLCGLEQQLDQGFTISEQEMECTFSENRSVPVSVSAARITNSAGDMIGQVIILRDLAEIRRLQAEIRRQEKLAAIGGLAAGVAHEIRNPLSSIKALASFFGGRFADDREAIEAARVMGQEVDRLNRSVTELLEFARPTDLKRQAVDISALVSRSLQLIQQDAANQSVDVSFTAEDPLRPAWVDPDRLAQCLLNLYLNAIQAMKNGGRLTIRINNDGDDGVIIRVSDTGRGISPDQISQVFDPYFTTKNKGTGLGLAVVYKIIEAHDGRVTVESTPEKGTTFSLRVPSHRPGAAEEA